MTKKLIYVIDASSLIEIEKLVTKDFFLPLFESLERFINSGNLISHELVLQELLYKDGREGDIYKWAKKQINFFKELDITQWETAQEIIQKFPNLIDPYKKNNADPFLIALAIIEEKQYRLIQPQIIKPKLIIIAEEVSSNDVNKPKIPDVCSYYKFECLNLNEFLKKELEIKIEFKNSHF